MYLSVFSIEGAILETKREFFLFLLIKSEIQMKIKLIWQMKLDLILYMKIQMALKMKMRFVLLSVSGCSNLYNLQLRHPGGSSNTKQSFNLND